jgi:hypothetical protein
VVTDRIKTTTKGKLMSYKFNPTVTEMRQAFDVAYGEYGAYHLIGVLFANVPEAELERIYRDTLDVVREQMKETETV